MPKRRPCVRTLLPSIVSLLLAGSAASAFSISSAGPGTAAGTYNGQTFTVNDGSHLVTGTNDCSVGSCFLQSWTWQLGNPAITSAGSLYIDIYDLDGGGYLGSSSTSVDVQGTGVAGGTVTWDFADLLVDPTHLLVAEISFDAVAGNAAQIRLDVQGDNVAGTLVAGSATPVDVGFDSIYQAQLLPEAGTVAMLALGITGLLASGTRRRP